MGMEGLGLGSPLLNAGAPSAGTDEVQTITIGGTPSGGTFLMAVGGVSASVAWSSTNATLVANIDAAIAEIYGVAASNFTTAVDSMTSGVGTITITYVTAMGKLAVALPTITNNLTGTSPTVQIAETTPGVTATHRGAPKSAYLLDTTNGKMYINTGTAPAPTWTVVGTQS